MQLAVALVNEDLPGIELPLATRQGLPGLGGARIQVVAADHRSDPALGAAETERLIRQDGVAAILGSYTSAVTAAASQRAEYLGIPFVNGDSSSPYLTERRDLHYFFRTGPTDRSFARAFFEFLDDLRSQQHVSIRRIAILDEDTEYGRGAAEVTEQVATGYKYEVAANISYRNGVNDVTREASQIRALNPDVLFQASYAPEAILFTETFQRLGYAPNVLAYGAGFSDAAFFHAVGKAGNYTISRAAWALDAVRSRRAAVKVAQLFKSRYGYAMDENSARTFTAALVLFQAINKAGETSPQAIRNALQATDVPAEDTIMPWKGITFDDRGQNKLARGVVVQYINGGYKLIWPFSAATAKVVWPLPAFDKR